MTNGKGCSGYPILTICLIKNVGKMIDDCLLTNHQLLGDLIIALATYDQLEHLDLA